MEDQDREVMSYTKILMLPNKVSLLSSSIATKKQRDGLVMTMINYAVIFMIQKLYIPDSPEVKSLLPPLHCVLQFKIEQQVTEPIRGQTCRQCWMIFSRVFMSKI